MNYFRTSRNQKQWLKALQEDRTVIVFDTETTGLDDDAKIIQLAAKKIKLKNFEVIDTFEELINPEWPLSGEITAITGFTDDDLKDKPNERELFPKIKAFFTPDCIIAAYNVAFDVKKMFHLFKRNDDEFKAAGVLDVIDMVRDMNKRIKSITKDDNGKALKPYALRNVAHTYNLDEGIDFHKADADVEATVRVMQLCMNNYLQNPVMYDGCEVLEVYSITYPTTSKQAYTESHFNVSTNKGLVYFNTCFKYWASTEVDLRFINIDRLEEDVIKKINKDEENKRTKTTPLTLHKFKRKVY